MFRPDDLLLALVAPSVVDQAQAIVINFDARIGDGKIRRFTEIVWLLIFASLYLWSKVHYPQIIARRAGQWRRDPPLACAEKGVDADE